MIKVDNSALVQSLEQFKTALKAKLEQNVRTFAYKITEEAIKNTPLGNSILNESYYERRKQYTGLLAEEGYARGSWQATISGGFQRQEFYSKTSGSQALAVASRSLDSFVLGQTISIGNTAYYIGALENNYSMQTAGLGIIQPTLGQIQSIYSISFGS